MRNYFCIAPNWVKSRLNLFEIKTKPRYLPICRTSIWAPSGCGTPEQYLQTPAQPKAIEFCDLAAQQDRIRPQLERNIHRVIHHGQYILGPEVAELEEKLAAYTGAKHCITVANGTDALQIAQMALGIGPGDEVITPGFTYIATAETVALLGAKPVYVDIDPRTYTIRVQDRDAVQEKLKQAGIPTAVHYPIPLNKQPAVANAEAQLPVGDVVACQVISLPMSPGLLAADQSHIAECLRTCPAV